ncbi:MAG: hypothetical protein AAGA99_26585 [Actinomycetota bacterium]
MSDFDWFMFGVVIGSAVTGAIHVWLHGWLWRRDAAERERLER